MAHALRNLIVPAEPRQFPGRRAIKISLRAIHVPCTGILTGAYVFDVGVGPRSVWLIGTIVSGLFILLLDLHESGVFLMQVRGLVTMSKIAVLAMLPSFAPFQGHVLFGLLAVSVLSSHAPSGIRYRLAFGRGRFKGATTKG